MARPKKPIGTTSIRTNIMLTPEAIDVLAKLPSRARSKFICDLIIKHESKKK